MNNLEKRKAELREYIEAREKATPGKWVSAGISGRMITLKGKENSMYEIADFDTKANSNFAIIAANESALIAEQLLECIEALEYMANPLRCLDIVYKPWPEIMNLKAQEALNKIAGEK